MTNLTKIFFSPSETTKKVVEQVAGNLSSASKSYDLLTFNQEKEFTNEDIVIVGMPVFAGRLPKTGSLYVSYTGFEPVTHALKGRCSTC